MKRSSPLMACALLCGLLITLSSCAANQGDDTLQPDWAIGPFSRPATPQPVIRPNASSTFYCPMHQKQVDWEARHTFNPGAIVKDGKIHVLYRAEDDSSRGGIGSFTSRIGLAIMRFPSSLLVKRSVAGSHFSFCPVRIAISPSRHAVQARCPFSIGATVGFRVLIQSIQFCLWSELR